MRLPLGMIVVGLKSRGVASCKGSYNTAGFPSLVATGQERLT